MSGTEGPDQIAEWLGAVLKDGVILEGRIEGEGMRIREASKAEYGRQLLDARRVLMGLLQNLFSYKSSQPGRTSPSINDRLVLISSFVQGVGCVERLVSEGQYIKASAVLKQDYELVARLEEIKIGCAVDGRTPNVRHAPEGSQRLYGELNDLAHPSKHALTSALLLRLVSEPVRGVSCMPVFRPEVAKHLYCVHILTLFHVARQALILAKEMYGHEDEGYMRSLRMLVFAAGLLEEAGFDVSKSVNGGTDVSERTATSPPPPAGDSPQQAGARDQI